MFHILEHKNQHNVTCESLSSLFRNLNIFFTTRCSVMMLRLIDFDCERLFQDGGHVDMHGAVECGIYPYISMHYSFNIAR